MTTQASGAHYERRNALDLHGGAPIRITKAFEALAMEVYSGEVPNDLKFMVFTVASVAAGCQHCQAHGAYFLSGMGQEIPRIHALWDFEWSDLFAEKEKAALRLARDAAQVPNAVTPDHFVALRQHWSDEEITELLAVVALGGFLNRWNDTMAVVTDQASVDWASANLAAVGWGLGKHAGASEEQRRPDAINARIDGLGDSSAG